MLRPISVKRSSRSLSKLFLHFSLACLQLLLALLLLIMLAIANKSTASRSGWGESFNTNQMSDIKLVHEVDCLVCPEVYAVGCV